MIAARAVSAAGGGREGVWRRRVVRPLSAFLAQGFTPAALARAIGLAAVCGLFPFLGVTTLLTLGAGVALRLNQPVMQAVNYALGPVQLVMIPVFVQAGAWLVGAEPGAFSVSAMFETIRSETFGEFLRQFGRAGVYAFVAWLAAAPFVFASVFFAARPALVRLAAGRRGGEGR
jgi:uncharacterized protein (DUF2062 family)